MAKKVKTYKGKSLKPGGGGKFARMVDDMVQKGIPLKRAQAIAAAMGRKKYGMKKMSVMATAGKKRAAKKKK